MKAAAADGMVTGPAEEQLVSHHIASLMGYDRAPPDSRPKFVAMPRTRPE